MIWVIDDDAYMLKLLGFKIRKLGHEVLLLGSAEEALAENAADPTHVFTDIHLNGRSGFELAEMLREKNGGIVLIALTSSDLSNDERATIFHHIFRKPLEDADLQAVFTPKLDFPYLNAMIDSEEDKLEIIRHFYEETTRDSDELSDAVDNADSDKMLLLTHRLSGRLAQFSQETISKRFYHSEQKLLTGEPDVKGIMDAIGQLREFLKMLEKL